MPGAYRRLQPSQHRPKTLTAGMAEATRARPTPWCPTPTYYAIRHPRHPARTPPSTTEKPPSGRPTDELELPSATVHLAQPQPTTSPTGHHKAATDKHHHPHPQDACRSGQKRPAETMASRPEADPPHLKPTAGLGGIEHSNAAQAPEQPPSPASLRDIPPPTPPPTPSLATTIPGPQPPPDTAVTPAATPNARSRGQKSKKRPSRTGDQRPASATRRRDSGTAAPRP